MAANEHMHPQQMAQVARRLTVVPKPTVSTEGNLARTVAPEQSDFIPMVIHGQREYTTTRILSGGKEGYSTISYLAESEGKQYVLKFVTSPFTLGHNKLAEGKEELSQAIRKIDCELMVKDEEVIVTERDVITVRPYIVGKDLEELVKETKFDEKEVQRLAIHIGTQSIAMNEINLVHADIKPRNVIKDRSGNYRLIDFGNARTPNGNEANDIASAIASQTSLTRLGMSEGYSAPETLTERVYFASDIYSLAQTMIYCLSGEKPDVILREPDFRFTQERIGGLQVSEQLKQVLLKATRVELKDRYDSMRAFLDDIIRSSSTSAVFSVAAKKTNVSEKIKIAINERLGKYQVPEALQDDIAWLLADFNQEYKDFVASRKDLEGDFKNKLNESLIKLGYEQKKSGTYIRKHKDCTDVDVLVLEKTKEYFAFKTVSESGLEAVLHPKPITESKAGEIVAATVGVTTGIVAEVAACKPYWYAPNDVTLALSWIAGVAQFFVSGITILLASDEEIEPKWIYRNTLGYFPGLGAYLATKQAERGIKNIVEKAKSMNWHSGKNALELALKPAKGFTYE